MKPITFTTLAGLPIGQQPPMPDLRADIAALARAMDATNIGREPWVWVGPHGPLLLSDKENWPPEAKEYAESLLTRHKETP